MFGLAMKSWTLDDVPWQQFDADKVDRELLAMVKAAAIVEHNGGDYETYLHGVFADDAAFHAAISEWAAEEVRHGKALARWAEMADPAFDFSARFARFTAGYRLPLDAAASVRGSRSGELIARCVVESGTSSFYSAVSSAAREPVLKEICRLIAADEFRHYKLFHDTLKRYLARDGIGRWRRIWVAAGRVGELRDDELAFAFHCANDLPLPYSRRRSARAYARRAYRLYRRVHFDLCLRMIMKAAGMNPRGLLALWAGRAGWRWVRWRVGGFSAGAV